MLDLLQRFLDKEFELLIEMEMELDEERSDKLAYGLWIEQSIRVRALLDAVRLLRGGYEDD